MTPDGLLQAAHEGLADGKADLAVRLLEQALQHRPDDASIWNNLALALLAAGRPFDAATMARRALKLNPGLSMAAFNLGRALSELGEHSDAAEAFARTLQLAPNPHAIVGFAASCIKSGDAARAIAALESGAKGFPQFASAFESHILFARHFDESSPEALARAHRDWAARHAAVQAPRPARVAKERIRVGYVSPGLSRTAMGFALWPVWRNHDRNRFEVYAYAGANLDDEATEAFRGLATAWRDIATLGDDSLAALIRDDQIDVLVDLAGHTPEGRLGVFALRPAPVQVSWLDYFDTTGLAAIDAVIADDRSAASAGARHFVERVLSVGPVRHPYAPPAYAPEVAPLPCTAGRPVTFACFARWAKVTAPLRKAWQEILRQAPGTRLILKADAFTDPRVRAQAAAEFAAAGVDAQRIDFRAPGPHERMLAELNEADVVLDTFPYNGGITTLEALWMGRPVVTRRGETMISAQGASLVSCVGLDPLVTGDDASYVACAVSLARDCARIARLATDLRGRMQRSALTDGAAFTRRLESLYGKLLGEIAA